VHIMMFLQILTPLVLSGRNRQITEKSRKRLIGRDELWGQSTKGNDRAGWTEFFRGDGRRVDNRCWYSVCRMA
jgi:hypothetical protein